MTTSQTSTGRRDTLVWTVWTGAAPVMEKFQGSKFCVFRQQCSTFFRQLCQITSYKETTVYRHLRELDLASMGEQLTSQREEIFREATFIQLTK
eukprot:2337042-Rhodomonas_salina.1